jgi:periplasmic divalent cation tolerance protein
MQYREICLPASRKPSPLPVMKSARRFAIVLVTAPSLQTARSLSRAALDARLVACANLIPKLESHYWWQGKLERSNEVLILFKTTRTKLAALEKLVLARHPYDTPEVIALPLDSGTPRYLDWIISS